MRDLRFVAHLDILGMSSIVEHDADAAWELLSNLIEVRDKISRYQLEFLETKERVAISESIQCVTFSDTILLFTKGSSDTDLRCMIVLVTEIFHKALCKHVPLRAGIAFGKFFFNLQKSMYAGPALIDAYRIGEAAQWLGISLAESVQERAIALNMTAGKSKVVVPWKLPIKDGEKSCSVVNWPAVVAHDFIVSPPFSVEQFYQPFERTFGILGELPPEVQAKYRNTTEFLNEHVIRHSQAQHRNPMKIR